MPDLLPGRVCFERLVTCLPAIIISQSVYSRVNFIPEMQYYGYETVCKLSPCLVNSGYGVPGYLAQVNGKAGHRGNNDGLDQGAPFGLIVE